MKKKNVIEFIPELDTGGAQALVRDYARLIDYSKFNLYIVTLYPQKKGANVELIKQTKAKILSIYPAHIIPFQLIDHICPIYAKSRLLLRIIKKTKADVVHVHVGLLRYLVPIRKELKNIKLLYTCHSLPSRYFYGRNEMEYEPAKILIKDNQLQLIGLHDEMRDELNRMFGVDHSIVIHNGVDFERLRNVKEPKTSIRRSLGIPENAFVMGHIGRFIEAKNHRFLIKIFRELTTRRRDAFLLLVGSGITEKEIHHLISSYGLENKVVHLKNRSDIPRLLKAMDVFVFPSLYEGLPLSIVESQVAGIRTVVSDRINGECFFNEDLIVKRLNEPPKVWVDAILDTRIKNFYNNDITIFDMNKVIRSLENVYSEKKR